jgi:hypothetical protein
VRTFVHRLTDERERVGELIDRSQVAFHFTNGFENWVVLSGLCRAEVNYLCHFPTPNSHPKGALYRQTVSKSDMQAIEPAPPQHLPSKTDACSSMVNIY